MKALLRNIIQNFHNQSLPEYKSRDIKIPVNSGKIITLIGSRRAGKTYVIYQIIKELLESTAKQNIIYISFEDERFTEEGFKLGDIIDAYYELYPDNKEQLYFFFDEIETIDGWEKFVRRIYDTYSKNIYLTGSSSKLLHREIATSLRGRSVYYEIFPLSFTEYLEFNSIEYNDVDSTINRAKLKNAFASYFENGAYPETVFSNTELRKKTLQTYLDVMIYRDIIERNKLNNITAVKYFIKKAIINASNRASISRLFNELKSQGVKVSKESLYNYMDYTQDCYLLYFVNLFDSSVSVQSANEKKIYCIDNGLINASTFKLSKDFGRLLENLVYLELRRRNTEIYYHSGKYECDFIIAREQEPQQAFQVTYEFDEQTQKREIRGLMEALVKYNLSEGTILTMEDEDEFEQDGKKIKIIPVWKWMIYNTKISHIPL